MRKLKHFQRLCSPTLSSRETKDRYSPVEGVLHGPLDKLRPFSANNAAQNDIERRVGDDSTTTERVRFAAALFSGLRHCYVAFPLPHFGTPSDYAGVGGTGEAVGVGAGDDTTGSGVTGAATATGASILCCQ
jgi:hypothetical protein